MALAKLRLKFARVFYQRCFYLFVSMIALIVIAPFAADFERGSLIVQVGQVLVLLAAVAAVGRTAMPFVIALLLGSPPVLLQLAVLLGLDDSANVATLTNAFYLAFYVMAILYLLRYVFSPEVMTDDKLFGAAAAYLMLGIGWAFAYNLVQSLNPDGFRSAPGAPPRAFFDLLYMSFGVLSSNGTGDVAIVGSRVKSLVILEQVAGVLYVAILIARLAGIYPPKQEKAEAP
ncbi:MAG: ion channel [Usitatibacter sp.]